LSKQHGIKFLFFLLPYQFLSVGAKIIDHGNKFIHQLRREESLQAEAWLNHYLETQSETMPHADIYHLHL